MGGVGYVRMFKRISKKTNTSYVRTRCWTKDNTQKGMDWNGEKKNDDTTGEETHEKLKERTTRREKKEFF
jgi:hypothetical protein